MRRLIQVGVGGYGRTWLDTVAQFRDRVEYAALVDVDPEVLEAARRRFDLAPRRCVGRLEDALALGEADSLLCVVPPAAHERVIAPALDAGLHVLSEKPIAVTVSEADRMIEACRRAGVLLGVMFQQRTEAVYHRAKEIVVSGALGELYRTTMIANAWYRPQAYYDSGAWRGTWSGEGGGVVMNQAPHSLDMFVWLGGQPSRVEARAWTRGHRVEVEDTVAATLEYPNGATGYLYTTTAEWPGENRVELVGDRGKLVVLNDQARLYRLDKPIREDIDTNAALFGRPSGGWEDVAVEPAPGGHAQVVRRFAGAVRRGEPLVATGEDGLAALELGNALLLAGYTGRPVDLPLDRGAYDAFLAEKRAGR